MRRHGPSAPTRNVLPSAVCPASARFSADAPTVRMPARLPGFHALTVEKRDVLFYNNCTSAGARPCARRRLSGKWRTYVAKIAQMDDPHAVPCGPAHWRRRVAGGQVVHARHCAAALPHALRRAHCSAHAGGHPLADAHVIAFAHACARHRSGPARRLHRRHVHRGKARPAGHVWRLRHEQHERRIFWTSSRPIASATSCSTAPTLTAALRTAGLRAPHA